MLVDILIVYIILLQLEPMVQRHLRGYAHSFSMPDTMFSFPELARLEVDCLASETRMTALLRFVRGLRNTGLRP